AGQDPNRPTRRFPPRFLLHPAVRTETETVSARTEIVSARTGPCAGAAIDPKCPAGSARDWVMSKTPPTSRRPLPPNRPCSNHRLPAWRSPRTARLRLSRPPGPRQSGGTGILIENENATGNENGISTGNATASANSARSSPKNHAGDQEDQPNRLILTSLPAAPSEPGFPSRRHPPTRTSLKSEAVIAPRQTCPRHTGR